MSDATLAVQELQAVEARVKEALANSPVAVLRSLSVDRYDLGLVISGTVKTFYQKQLAQEAVRSVAKEVTLINAVKVHGARDDDSQFIT